MCFEKQQNVNINNLRGKLDDLITGNAMLEDKLDKALQVAEAAKNQVVTLTKTVDILSAENQSLKIKLMDAEAYSKKTNLESLKPLMRRPENYYIS